LLPGLSRWLSGKESTCDAGDTGSIPRSDPLHAAGKTVHLIGGCDVAMELDARRAIAQGTRLALEI